MSEREKPRMIRALELDKDGKPLGYKTVRTDDIAFDSRRRATLTAQQRERAVKLWPSLGRAARADATTPDEWADGFAVEADPDAEIAVWEKIVSLTDRLWVEGVGKTREQVQEVVIAVSVGAVDIPSQVPGVTDAMVERVRNEYNL